MGKRRVPNAANLPTTSFFKALADENRLNILSWLCACAGPRRVSEVARCCDVDLSVVSRHLTALRSANILGATRKGKEVFYSVNTKALVSALRNLADAIEGGAPCCPPSNK